MGRWSRKLAPLLVQFARRCRDGDAVVDIGSGTGALTAAIVAAAPSSRVFGIDPSEPYVAYAQAASSSKRVCGSTVADAQHLPFKDASFDRTLSLLILNFIPDPEKALKEMVRVTRPGGTIAACGMGLRGRDEDVACVLGRGGCAQSQLQTGKTSDICRCPAAATCQSCGANI